ncbi:efflux RND transporter periplasmic adaptor subunit [Sorangium sp. So ce136]|uniref:efflux RND transporter periplasmic adaptor subunit n=1 Tax=Sorangium sp. So ce136 TaxID=3133284 RepID=UPI003F07EA5D
MKTLSIWFLAVVYAAVAVTGLGCKKKEAPAGKRGARAVEYPVEVAPVEVKPQDFVVAAPGVLEAFERVQITARVSGVIDKVSFAEGEEVKPGKVLAYIDSRRYQLAVSSAKAALEKAEATQADVARGLERRSAASQDNPGLIPGEELESYQTKLRTAKADVDQAREALKTAQLNLSDSSVTAPQGGVIQTRSVETGQFVQAGTLIATLLRSDPLLLRFQVTTAEAPRLKVGMPVEFTLRESATPYEAKITLVAASADPESRLVPVTAEVAQDRKYWLRPGSFANVRVTVGAGRPHPIVPQLSVRPSDRGFLAFVVEEGVARERVLKLGMHTREGDVEVREGLNGGEQLVVRGAEPLSDGVRVRLVPPGTINASAGGGRGPAGERGGRSGGADAGAPAPDTPPGEGAAPGAASAGAPAARAPGVAP